METAAIKEDNAEENDVQKKADGQNDDPKGGHERADCRDTEER